MLNLIQVVISLIGIIGLIFLLFYLLRKVGRYNGLAQNGRLKIIDRVAASRESSLLVVSVGGKLMLIGVSAGKSAGNIEKLCDLDMSEEEYRTTDDANLPNSQNPANPPANFATFADVLSNVMGFGKKHEKANDKKHKNHEKERGRYTVEPDNQKGNEREGQ